ncbi:hypothetical protein [Actinopolymorpha singaporensis]
MLVRPGGVVAWRSAEAPAGTDARAELGRALRTVLARG